MTDVSRQLQAAANLVALFTGDPGFARLPAEAPITMGSRMALRQLSAGDFRAAHTALAEGLDALARGADGAAVRDPVHAALKPVRDFVAAGGFNLVPDDMPITTDRLRRRLTAGDLRLLAGLPEILEQEYGKVPEAGIEWLRHDDIEDGFASACGRFEVSTDPTYGNFRLHRAGDTTESLGESMRLAEITVMAGRLVDEADPEP
jgi:hypothetical protein